MRRAGLLPVLLIAAAIVTAIVAAVFSYAFVGDDLGSTFTTSAMRADGTKAEYLNWWAISELFSALYLVVFAVVGTLLILGIWFFRLLIVVSKSKK